MVDLSQSKTPWSLGHKLRRGLWMAVWAMLGRWGPRPFSPWRILLLRLFGAQIGRNVLVCGQVKVLMPWNLKVGDQSALSERVDVYNFGQVEIGANVVVSQGVWLCTGSHDYTLAHFPLVYDDIRIGDSAWIAAESFVAPGVRIGEGAVVAARSVVTRDLEAWGVYAGNPCRFIKARQPV